VVEAAVVAIVKDPIGVATDQAEDQIRIGRRALGFPEEIKRENVTSI